MSTDHNFWRERRAEAESNWGPSAYQPYGCRTSSLNKELSLFSSFLRAYMNLPKWFTYSAIWLLHGWCHVKLLPSRRTFCVMHKFTVSLHSCLGPIGCCDLALNWWERVTPTYIYIYTRTQKRTSNGLEQLSNRINSRKVLIRRIYNTTT